MILWVFLSYFQNGSFSLILLGEDFDIIEDEAQSKQLSETATKVVL